MKHLIGLGEGTFSVVQLQLVGNGINPNKLLWRLT